jgi:outer membrane protein
MKNTKPYLILISIFLSISLFFGIYNFLQTPKIGFVITGELVNNYAGMKEAMDEYNVKHSKWQGEIDTLILLYETKVADYQANEMKYSREKKESEKEGLMMLGQKINNYKQSLEEEATKENQRMIQGALNQINSFIEDYSKEHNYDYIIGVTEFGNVLYAKDKLDITEDVIKAINEDYEGQ